MAVLIHAPSTAAESAGPLFEALAECFTATIRRAYADWTKPALRQWQTMLRRHGIQPLHHFADDPDEQALVAMVTDAVDIARDASVDVVAIVGDLGTAIHPLTTRLRAAGIGVLAFGPSTTPEKLRAAYDEFIDLTTLTDRSPISRGRHIAEPAIASHL